MAKTMCSPTATPSAARRSPHRPWQRDESGVSLIELLVGMAIGLLTVLVITQVMSLYESQKRSTTAGADAQINGAVALHALQRELQMAGWGMTSGGAAGCQTRYKFQTAATREFSLAPVEIGDGGSGGADTLTIRRGGDSQGAALPVKIKGHFRNATQFDLDGATNIAFAQSDLVLAVPKTLVKDSFWCVLFNVSETAATGAIAIKHEVISAAPWNQSGNDNPDNSPVAPATVALHIYPGAGASDVAFEAGSYIVNLGSLVGARYRIQQGKLQKADVSLLKTTGPVAPLPADEKWQDLQPQIVDLQAVYGKDSSVPRDNVADVWNSSTPTTAEEWSRVVAVRIALVARSAHFEKEEVTAARPADCSKGPPATGTYPVWSPAGDGNWECLNVNGQSDWQHFRYKVFETVVPLRNVLWQS